MKLIYKIWKHIVKSDTLFFYRCKKTIFVFSLLIVVSPYLESNHDGSIIATIWDHLFIISPTIILIVVTIMFIKGYKELS